MDDWFVLNGLLDKIERPTRSGVEGSLCALVVLFGLITSDAVGGGDPWCDMFFWRCTAEANEQPQHKWRDMHVQIIGPGKGHGRVCTVEFSISGTFQGKQLTLATKNPAYYLDSCDEGHESPEWHGDKCQFFWTDKSGELSNCTREARYYWSDRIVSESCENDICKPMR